MTATKTRHVSRPRNAPDEPTPVLHPWQADGESTRPRPPQGWPGADRLKRGSAPRRPPARERDPRQVMKVPAMKAMKMKDTVNRRVLIVDDQQDIHDDFWEMLQPRVAGATDELVAAFVEQEERQPDFLPEFELLHALSGEHACQIVREGRESGLPVAAAYVDIRMPPGMDGVETIRRIRAVDSEIEIVIMTAYADKPLSEIVSDMKLLHKLLYIRKPFAREEIQQITMSLVEKWNVERELAERRRQILSSHRRLESVLDATGDAIAMYDVDDRLVFANRWYEELVGASEDELRRMAPGAAAAHVRDRFREPRLEEAECRFLIAGGDGVVEPVGAAGVPDQRLFHRSKTVLRDDGGEVTGDLYVYRDVSKMIEAERMKAEVVRLRDELETTYSFDGLVGSGAGMGRVYALMKRAVEGDITVLVRGESGTGKELVAKSLHFSSARKEGPFLVVNCAAVPESLIESELFGHEQGAFTGAARRRIGTFERAAGGTILLDEIGDMQHALQAKLLRVLQEREIQRVGGTESIAVDVRVIAATNKDLEAAMRVGEFREDLYYRLAAFPIVVPPLRERREDIPLLARHLLRRQAKALDKPVSGISTGAMRLLLQYGWPGNVRELENVIERAVLLETSEMLQAESLPEQLWPALAGKQAGAAMMTLAEVERRALVQALEASGNNVNEAAQALGVNRATLYRKLKRYALAVKR